MKRWVVVGSVGVVCGALVGGLFHALTRMAIAASVMGVATAAILVVLAFAGARYNRTYQPTADRAAVAAAKRERARKAIEETRERR